MEFLKSIWRWFVSLFSRDAGFIEVVADEDYELDKILEAIDEEVKAEEEEHETVERSVPSQSVRFRVARQLARRAEEFERDQEAFMEFLQDNGRDDVLFAMNKLVNWDLVFGNYSEETLQLLVSRGTNIQLNMAHARLMRRMAELERAERFAVDVPEGHGMDDKGAQH